MAPTQALFPSLILNAPWHSRATVEPNGRIHRFALPAHNLPPLCGGCTRSSEHTSPYGGARRSRQLAPCRAILARHRRAGCARRAQARDHYWYTTRGCTTTSPLLLARSGFQHWTPPPSSYFGRSNTDGAVASTRVLVPIQPLLADPRPPVRRWRSCGRVAGAARSLTAALAARRTCSSPLAGHHTPLIPFRTWSLPFWRCRGTITSQHTHALFACRRFLCAHLTPAPRGAACHSTWRADARWRRLHAR